MFNPMLDKTRPTMAQVFPQHHRNLLKQLLYNTSNARVNKNMVTAHESMLRNNKPQETWQSSSPGLAPHYFMLLFG